MMADLADEKYVQILGLDAGAPGQLFSFARDAKGNYYAPVVPDPHVVETWRRGITGLGQTLAVLDTGVWLEHPVISAALAEGGLHDLTDEGPDDLHGHGTAVALIALAVAPDQQLVSVKIMRRDGRGDPDDLVEGLRIAANLGVDIVNVSAGIFRPNCRGDCPICQAAAAAAVRVGAVFAAAGNEPRRTTCPAKYFQLSNRGFAVEAVDAAGHLERYSGVGNTPGTVYDYPLRPVG
jgi:thermitase